MGASKYKEIDIHYTDFKVDLKQLVHFFDKYFSYEVASIGYLSNDHTYINFKDTIINSAELQKLISSDYAVIIDRDYINMLCNTHNLLLVEDVDNETAERIYGIDLKGYPLHRIAIIPFFDSKDDNLMAILVFAGIKMNNLDGLMHDTEVSLILQLIREKLELYFNGDIASIMLERISIFLTGQLNKKDPFTFDHSYNVAHWVMLLSKEFGLDEKTTKMAYYASLLHDVGKLGIPDEILNKNGKLTEEEYIKIKEHPILSCQYINEIFYDFPDINDISKYVRYHHERYDGTGYPDGLSGRDIPFISRLIAVADCIDAMRSGRPYAKSKTTEEIIAELESCSGTQFDPEIVLKAIDLLKKKKSTNYSLMEYNYITKVSIIIYLTENRFYVDKGILKYTGQDYILLFQDFQVDSLSKDIMEIQVAFNDRQNFFEYMIKEISGIGYKRLIFKKLEAIEKEYFYKILWELNGFIKNENSTETINIKAISGNHIEFESPYMLPIYKGLAVGIQLPDSEVIPVYGFIKNIIHDNGVNRYTLEFVSINTNTRDKILKAILSEQIKRKRAYIEKQAP
ncbi:HD-GYP domain-containing protein [Calorimonas adulescens]|uniref:HD-GYP domain-containing protein n=1 Tax=Calorimonas adulescens TaxID=2606906 RepID=UPI00139690D0|nr:HD-GYP domain-containing protein [Calorimonas adulescens]